MVHRWLVVGALATAVLALAIGWSLGGLHDSTGEGAAAASRTAASTVAVATAPTGPDVLPGGAGIDVGSHAGTGADRGAGAADGTGDGTRGGDVPCVMRADCAGALVLGGLGLVLALPAAAPIAGGLTPASPVVPATPSWHPTPRATRFFRPPRLSCALSW